MIFNIPEWPSDSNIDHYATTWQLSRDINFTQIEDTVNESSTDLLVWEVSKIIPTGEIWYVRALRHLKDENGNTITNTNWVGPKPVFSEESNVNEYLAPKFYIDKPYIKDIIFKPGEFLQIELVPYKTNVGYTHTIVSLENELEEIIITKFINIDSTDNKVTINNNELNFTDLDYLKIKIVHIGTQSTISTPAIETVNLKKIYYKVISTTKNIDPVKPLPIEISSTTYGGVTLTAASVYSIDNQQLATCNIENNKIYLPDTLDFNKSYIVKFTIQYTDNNGNVNSVDDSVIISTREYEEIVPINKDRVYENKLEMIDIVEPNSPYNKFKTNIDFNTEELYTYTIPMPDKDTNKISLFVMDRETNFISKYKQNIINITQPYSFRLLTKEKGIVQYVKNNETIIRFVTYNPYNETFSLSNEVYTNIKSSYGALNKVVMLDTGAFIAGINKSNTKQVIVKELNLDNNTITQKATYNNDVNMSDASCVEYGKSSIAILPNNSSEYRIFIYSSIEKYIDESIALPTSFRNIKLLPQRLDNGDIICFKLSATEDEMDYFILNIEDSKITTYSVSDNDSKKITNIIALKNGNILSIVENNNIKELWLYH